MKLSAGARTLISALALFSGVATAIAADPADKVKLRYDVTFAGVRALELRYDATLGNADYKANVDVALKGIAKMMLDFDMEIATAGNVTPAGLKPTTFRMVTSDDEKNRTMNVSWGPDGMPIAKRNYTLNAKRTAQLTETVKPGMSDPLTVIMSMAMTPQGQLCNGTTRAYNGAEVIDYTFTKLGVDQFGKESKGAYRGTATRCKLALKPIAGVSDKRLRKWAKNPPVYTVWFAPASAPGTGKAINLIVAAEGEASGRKFRAIASTATVAGAALNKASLASN